MVLDIGNTTPLLDIAAVGGACPGHLHTFPAVDGFDQIDPIRHIGDRGEGETLIGAGVAALLGNVDAIGGVAPDIGTFVAMGGDQLIGTVALGNGLPLLIAAGDVVPLINIGPIRPANPGHIERLAAVDIGNLIVAITNGGELPLVVLGIGNTTPLLDIAALGCTCSGHLHTFPAVDGFDQINPIRHRCACPTRYSAKDLDFSKVEVIGAGQLHADIAAGGVDGDVEGGRCRGAQGVAPNRIVHHQVAKAFAGHVVVGDKDKKVGQAAATTIGSVPERDRCDGGGRTQVDLPPGIDIIVGVVDRFTQMVAVGVAINCPVGGVIGRKGG